MPAIAPDLTRRTLLLAGAASLLRADDAEDIWDLFTDMAAALSDNKAPQFMQAFDPSMAGYDGFQQDVAALLLEYEVHSSIELLNEEGDSRQRTVALDWFLQIVEKQDTAGVTRRRETVRCRLMKQKRKWRITTFEPLAFFKPPKPPG